MKIGTDTGSLTNYLMSGTIGQPKPVIGMGVTKLSWTDRHPGTIVEILMDGKVIGIQEDDARRIDGNGMSECQEYEYTPNTSASIEYYKLDRKGAYRAAVKNEKGRFVFVGGQLRIGERDKYHDFSF